MDRVGAVTVHIKVATIINWRCVQLVDGNGTRSVKLLITRETFQAAEGCFISSRVVSLR